LIEVRFLSQRSGEFSQGFVLRYGRDAVKKLLRERLLSGWILVTGDSGCIEDFKKKYYGEGSKDFEDHAIMASVKQK
jgi:hypothetical protein